jgi:hypothetical protein
MCLAMTLFAPSVEPPYAPKRGFVLRMPDGFPDWELTRLTLGPRSNAGTAAPDSSLFTHNMNGHTVVYNNSQ